MDELSRVAFAVGGTDSACSDLCLELSKRGYNVCLMDYGIGAQSNNQSGAKNSAGPVEFIFPAEKFSSSELSISIVDTAERYGGVDTLIYQYCPRTEQTNIDMLLDIDERDWDDAMDSGAKGFFLACKFILPYLINRPGSVIIVLKTRSPLPSEARLTEYVAARALEASLEHMSQEVSQYGISIIQKEIDSEREWMSEILTELAVLRKSSS
ncbi:MAG: SDR family NAD(P)-dependent oxidoreductase [Synergistaceae bacterium]|nr:SDR family NAD(P)-dependent oxidoreductase [Synergistaceae bacterium]